VLIVAVEFPAYRSASLQFHENDFAEALLEDFVGDCGHFFSDLVLNGVVRRGGSSKLKIRITDLVC